MPIYRVKPGDTLERIARRECGDRKFVEQIVRDNHIANPSLIRVGQELILNCGEETSTTGLPLPTTANLVTPPKSILTGGKDTVLLDVPYHSQEDADAKWAAADCGPACVRMLIGWNALRQGQPDPNLSIDEVAKATGMGRNRFSFPRQLVAVGEKYGLKLEYRRDAKLAAVLAELDAGRPVISLIRYANLKGRQNQRFRGGHFVVVAGYNDREIVLNDPDWWGNNRNGGAGFRVPRAEFEGAIGLDNWKAGNDPYQAIFVKADSDV
jgi:LysM repeat protein